MTPVGVARDLLLFQPQPLPSRSVQVQADEDGEDSYESEGEDSASGEERRGLGPPPAADGGKEIGEEEDVAVVVFHGAGLWMCTSTVYLLCR